ncbi:MAG: hypothetical protein K2J81_07065, partial [Treponemataceae bacterium]|nr:hypothetical protein [Treponemataceae bacterium]
FWQKSRQDEENAARFRRKHVGASKTPRVLTENASGQRKSRAFLQKYTGTTKTPSGGAFPTQKRATPEKVFPVTTRF